MTEELSFSALQFIGESISVNFLDSSQITKKPAIPSSFVWRGKEYFIEKLISQWQDFSRKGRYSRNMSDFHKERAEIKGSFGVGRFYFRVITQNGRIFDLYYDRSVKDSSHKSGSWALFQELINGN